MNFSQGHSGKKKFNVNRACFPKDKHQNSQYKKGEIHELFVLALSLVWFAGATPEFSAFLPSAFSEFRNLRNDNKISRQ